MKNLCYLFPVLLLIVSCENKVEKVQVENVGYAQGTTYQLKYLSENGRDYAKEIGDIFRAIDQSMSTYEENSLISLLNKGDTSLVVDSLFGRVMQRSMEIAEETEGAFDPTIGALVNMWGFGKEGSKGIDTLKVDSIRQYTGYGKIRYDGTTVYLPRGFKMDFNAIAQGYTVDVLATFLESKGISNYMVEVGGEVRASGLNADEEVWRIGIDKPSEEINENDRFQIIVALKNAALATSGNYRKFWIDEETGMKYAHTIDPATGFPARNRLLSVSVIAPSAMDADAYATVCMVKGVSKAIRFINSKKELEAYFIYTNEDGEWETYQTKGFKEYVLN